MIAEIKPLDSTATRTRIVCTLGPASDSEETLRAFIRAGMDVARVNFSHGTHPEHAARIERVRRLAAEMNAIVAVMGDLQGPKLRVGEIAGGSAHLEAGAEFGLTTARGAGDARGVSVDFDFLPRVVEPGQRILLDDGAIELRVEAIREQTVVTRVVVGGDLLPHKGVNLPGVRLPISALTEKDRADAEFAIAQEVDYLALSFVRAAQDIRDLADFLKSRGVAIPIIAKIEKREALDAIDEILAAADGVMVARGDLGVEVAAEAVPIHQKHIIRKANALGKPVITATQMLESMIHNPRPTRAEASDVANAILDGSDAVMLSGETAVGAYPLAAVEMMQHIARVTEANLELSACSWETAGEKSITDSIGSAVCHMASELDARVIVTSTASGYSARMIARHRPKVPILAVTSDAKTQRRLALVWGIKPVLVERVADTDALVEVCLRAAIAEGLVEKGDRVVLTGGVPVGVSGRTNMIQVRTIE
jgi:pyruvate kinase